MHCPLIVDTDGGIDDALAILMLAANNRPPEFITTCFGNVPLEQASNNILDTLAHIGCMCPVFAGSDRPILGPAVHATHIHGEDGLGNAKRPNRKTGIQQVHAVDALRERLKLALEENKPIDLLTIGPLTNIALVFILEPVLTKGINRLIVMGGTCRGRGNVTETAEFNIFADPEAASVVLYSVNNAELVTWEPCVDNPVAGNVVDSALESVPSCDLKDFVVSLCDQGRKVNKEREGFDALVLPDPLAVAVLLEPEIVLGSLQCPLSVECTGELTRGMTVPLRQLNPEKSHATVNVIETIDAKRLESLFIGCLNWIGTSQ